jgi:hypothetical protein
MMFSKCRTAAFVLGMGISATVLADASSFYQQGIAAFKTGQFETALNRFEEAEKEGMQTATLHYNLGSTYYRLNRFADSARHFKQIRDDGKWGALAEYNLGLIAERQNDNLQALQHYRQAYRKADTERVTALSAAKIQALTGEAKAGLAAWSGYVSAARGYDDNPALTGVEDTAADESSDSFIEALGVVSGYLTGDRREGTRLSGGFYSRTYDDAHQFNVAGLYAGAFRDQQVGDWHTALGLSLDNYWLDGNQYTTGIGLVAHAQRPLTVGNLDVRNQLSYIKGDGAFEYLDGIRNRLTVSWIGGSAEQRWKLGYIQEVNNRKDFDDAPTFQSYSPVQHSVFGQLTSKFTQRFSTTARLEYRNSRYQDDDVVLDENDNAISARRNEDRLEGSLMGRYELNRTFGAFAEYRYTDNDSNINRYVYESNQFMVGIDASF